MKTISSCLKKVYYRTRLLSIFLFLFSIKSFAQCPGNIGFETGDLSGWETIISGDVACSSGNIGTGNVCTLPPSPTNPVTPLSTCLSLGFNQQIFTNTRAQVVNLTSSITSNILATTTVGIDPFSSLPIVCPAIAGNQFSLKLGDDNINDSAETERMQFTVTQAYALTYRFMAIMDMPPSHNYCTQPRIEFNVYDLGPTNNHYATKVISPCASVIIPTPPPSALPPGWFNVINPSYSDTVVCSNWIPVSVNLLSLVGHDVEVEFTTGDCALGGHFGYAYIDVECSKFEIATKYCIGDTTATLYAPKGYVNYVWDSIGNTSGVPIATGQDSLFISPAHDGTVIKLDIYPSSSSCSVTLYDTVHVTPPPTAKFLFNPMPGCVGYNVNFIDTSRSNYKFAYIDYWGWNFGDVASGAANTSQQRFPTHTFNRAGTYFVKLVVKTNFQCISVDDIKTVYIEQPSVHLLDSANACYRSAYHLSFFSDSNIIGAHWFTKNAIGNLSCVDCLDPLYSGNQNNRVFVFYTDTHGCTSTDSIQINWEECPELIIPSAFTPNDDGANDYFFLLNRKFAFLNTFEVFNRWGELVYTTNDLNAKGWDGTYKGKPQPSEVYVFHVVATDVFGNVKTKKGNVTLLR